MATFFEEDIFAKDQENEENEDSTNGGARGSSGMSTTIGNLFSPEFPDELLPDLDLESDSLIFPDTDGSSWEDGLGLFGSEVSETPDYGSGSGLESSGALRERQSPVSLEFEYTDLMTRR